MTADTGEVDWASVGFVTASDYRTRVVDALTESPATPTTLSKRADLHISHVSRTLTALQEQELVELLVPEDQKKGRIYGLTDAGEAIAEEVEG